MEDYEEVVAGVNEQPTRWKGLIEAETCCEKMQACLYKGTHHDVIFPRRCMLSLCQAFERCLEVRWPDLRCPYIFAECLRLLIPGTSCQCQLEKSLHGIHELLYLSGIEASIVSAISLHRRRMMAARARASGCPM